MIWIKKECVDCKVELDKEQLVDVYQTICFKCKRKLEIL